MSRLVDVAIVGAGTAGMAAFRAARRAGARPLLIEDGRWGTTCARVGCMPSKLLISAARSAAEALHGGTKGVHAAARVDGWAVLEHVRKERDHFVAGVRAELAEIATGHMLTGRARFTGPTTLAVGDEEIRARAVVVATGARPEVPKVLAPLGELVLTEESIFEIGRVPSSLAVLGAGPVGLELAQAFTRLGARVVVLETRPSLSVLSDPEVEQAARDALRRELDLRLGVTLQRAHREGDVALLTIQSDDGTVVEERVAFVLAATGRKPSTGGLGLESLALPRHASGAPRIDPHTLQWGDAPVFFAGDVTGEHPVLHEATRDGERAGANAARYPRIEPSPPRVGLSLVFSDPNIAIVGERWSALTSRPIVSGTVRFERQGRARIDGRPYGMLRVYASRDTGALLGAELCAPEGEHLAHWLALAMHAGLDVERARTAPAYHPTLHEGLVRALTEACKARNEDTADDPGLRSLG